MEGLQSDIDAHDKFLINNPFPESTCCSDPQVTSLEDITHCANCNALIEDVEFDTNTLDFRTNSSTRLKKFKLFICGKDLPWYVIYTLGDLFPVIEQHFQSTSRINFVNTSQLTRILLKVIGYPEYIHQFTPLKTKSRVDQIKIFVDTAISSYYGQLYEKNLKRLEDLELIEFPEPFINPVHLDKALPNTVFSDRLPPIKRPF